jgi:hypothetical protein
MGRTSRVVLAIAISVVMALALVPCTPWFEEEVLGSRHVARFYRDIGLDAPLNWLANTLERLH